MRTTMRAGVVVICCVGCAMVLPLAAAEPGGVTVAGHVQGAVGGGPVTVVLEGHRTYRTVSRGDGSWQIADVEPGTYTVRPHAASYQFEPAEQRVTVVANERTRAGGIGAGASPRRHSLRGRVEGLGHGERVEVVLSGGRTYRTMTGPDGEWQLEDVRPGTYQVRAVSGRHVFTPAQLTVRVRGTRQQTLVLLAQ